MKLSLFLRKKFVWMPVAAIFIVWVALGIYRVPAAFERQRTAEAVEFIKSRKLTLADVNGSNLPPAPSAEIVDATIAGVDANGNFIRDDVELAIYKKYPKDIKVRAAELQYAMALQLYLTHVFNEETWKVVAKEQDSRAYACVSMGYPRTNLEKYFEVTDRRIKEVENLVFNTEERKDAEKHADTFTTSFGLAGDNFCDIEI